MGGRSRVPERLKRLKGTMRPDRARAGSPSKVIKARCPRGLSPAARRIWRALVPDMAARGVLVPSDLAAAMLLCTHLALALEAAQVVQAQGVLVPDPDHPGAEGTVPMRKNPALTVLAQQSDLYRRYCSLFGLTPLDRERLAVPEPEPVDELTEFLGRGSRLPAGEKERKGES